MRVTILPANFENLMFLGLVFLVVACMTATAVPPQYMQERYSEESQADLEEKNALINKLLGAMVKMMPEERDPYLDAVKDQEVKRALLSKKANSICHFKLCNLGKRRRR